MNRSLWYVVVAAVAVLLGVAAVSTMRVPAAQAATATPQLQNIIGVASAAEDKSVYTVPAGKTLYITDFWLAGHGQMTEVPVVDLSYTRPTSHTATHMMWVRLTPNGDRFFSLQTPWIFGSERTLHVRNLGSSATVSYFIAGYLQ